MKCTKCGYEQQEGLYCKSCCNKFEEEVSFEVEPVYNFTYMAIPSIIVEGIATLFVSLIFLLLSPIVSIIMFICGVLAITINIKMQAKHYEKHIYVFNNEKVCYMNSSKNKIKREMKYLDITGIEYSQSSLQKKYNLGNIILYNDATVTGNNELIMKNILNPMEWYNKIKNTIGIDNMDNNNSNNSNIVHQIVPKFKIGYQLFNTICLFFLVAIFIYRGAAYDLHHKRQYIDIRMYLIIISIIFIFMIVYYFLEKKNFEKIEYNFYSHKFVYINNFWGTYIKEIKYTDIESAFIKQNPIQRIFNIGKIKLVTKMSRIVTNRRGMHIVKDNFSINSIENVEKEYQHIMQIIDDAKYKD